MGVSHTDLSRRILQDLKYTHLHRRKMLRKMLVILL